ncbi:hypothetical protein D3C83_163480 [compost metagenome]
METLVTHRDKLDALAAKLIAEETVDAEAFESLFTDLPPKSDPHGDPPKLAPLPKSMPSPAPNPA